MNFNGSGYYTIIMNENWTLLSVSICHGLGAGKRGAYTAQHDGDEFAHWS